MTEKSKNFYQAAFRNSVFVLKVSGKILSDKKYLNNVIKDIRNLQDSNIKIVLVCGFGIQLDELTKKIFNKDPQKINGRRITSLEDLESAKMCCGKIVSDISELMQKNGIVFRSYFPISKDIIKAKRRQIVDKDFGFVADIIEVESSEIKNLLDHELLLLMPSLVFDYNNGDVLNINADSVASKIAIEIKADKLIFISDIDSVKDKNGNRLSVVKISEIEKMKANGTITDGMIVKLENAREAIKNGVSKIHIISGIYENAIYKEIFSEDGIGTAIEDDTKEYNY